MIETSLTQQTNVLTWNRIYSGLSSAATVVHFHGLAAVLATADTVARLMGVLTSPIKSSETLTSTQSTHFIAGM